MDDYKNNKQIENIRYSLQNHTLINVIQASSSIFYTGMVIAIDDQGIIMTTYTESGLANGLVYLTYQDIANVDIYSEDIARMENRILISQKLKLNGTEPAKIKLNNSVDLVTQVLGNAFVYQQALLVILKDGEMMECFVSSLGKSQVQLTIFDKFDGSNSSHKDILKGSIRSIEFLGLELQLLSRSKKLLLTMHEKSVEEQQPLQIFASLHHALESGRRIVMIPRVNPELFFIGQVKAINNEAVVFSVVDMNGQFGGYELIKINEIGRVILKNDYLRLINHFVALNLADDNYKQPILNDDRSFDSTIDLFMAILNQAYIYKRFIRIKVKNGDSYFGIPVKIDDKEIMVRYIDKADPYVTKRKIIEFDKVDELAFGYLDAVLAKKRIMGNK